MKLRDYALLALMGLLTSGLVAWMEHWPGYMDADYYTVTGWQLVNEAGFQESFLWNFLDDPQGIPHPSYTYWMPLASVLAAGGMRLTGFGRFAGARIGFLALAWLLPPLTAAFSWRLTHCRRSALLAGSMAALSGFYLPYLPTTDTFGITMLLGALFLLTLRQVSGGILVNNGKNTVEPEELSRSVNEPNVSVRLFSLGLLTGLLHLTRVDGLLWLLVALGVGLCSPGGAFRNRRASLKSMLLVLLGYLIPMAPWYWRNLIVFHRLFPPGGMRTLWLLDYDELFTYPAELLVPSRWWSAGIGELVQDRLWALGQNVQTIIAVQGGIFLVPFIVWGLWRLRSTAVVRWGVLLWGGMLGVMTLVFPFAGVRGGFFHSGAGVQPLFWAVFPLGLDAFIQWGAQRRGWEPQVAWRVFSGGLVVIAIGLSGFVVRQRVWRSDGEPPGWGSSLTAYVRVEDELQGLGAQPEDRVLVNNPPGYALATGRAAVVIPNGDLSTVRAVAKRYHARYLLLEPDHPQGLAQLYQSPRDGGGLVYLSSVGDIHLFRIELVDE
jgi:hypothetical protein